MSKPADIAAQIVAHAETRRKRGPKCRVCILPKDWLDAIHKARAGIDGQPGAEYSAIHDYLVKHSPFKDLTISSVSHHFHGRHETRG